MWKKTRKMKLELNAEKIFLASELPMSSVFSYFQTAPQGLSNEEVEKDNRFTEETKWSMKRRCTR